MPKNLSAPPPSPQVYVSLKRLQEDPLRQTLDKVMPLDGAVRRAARAVRAVPAVCAVRTAW